ncbi:MAG: ABC transporter permease [Planctomycetaceae bacterium]|nr:ABC transporter permease [Planctomycetaceae bacterium]
MVDYLSSQYGKLTYALVEHLELVGIVIALFLALAVPLTLLSLFARPVGVVLNCLFSILYAIPSLAMFSLMIPVTGLGKPTAILVLTLYNQYLLLRNFLAGLENVDPAVVEAATGMGMTRLQTVWRVRLPLSLGPLFAGLRLSVVSTIGIATIAAAINAGGLGAVLFDGLRTMNTNKIVAGSILSALVALAANWLLGYLEHRLTAPGGVRPSANTRVGVPAMSRRGAIPSDSFRGEMVR